MAKRYEELSDDHIEFINHQKISYVGTAANDGTINVSPKGFNSSRVLSPNRIMWMNITGSSNETTAHLSQNNRMTMTFCAFDRSPKYCDFMGKEKLSILETTGGLSWKNFSIRILVPENT